MSYAAALVALLGPTECHGEKVLRILGGARPVPNATADSSKAYTLPKELSTKLPEVFRKYGLWASRPGIEARSLTISARQEPSDEFFCSFLDHPGSHLDQVYDSPPAYFWCANPGVADGTLAVMVGASCGAMPGRAARCLSSVHGQLCSVRRYLEMAPRDFMLYVGSDSL